MHPIVRTVRFSRECVVAGLLISLGAIALSSCGGSGGAGGGGTPPSPSFTIVVNPSAPVLAPGTTAALQVSLLTQGGFDSAVSVAITGLPTGISAQPAFLSLSPGGAAQPVQLSAQATVAPGTYGAQFQGTAGGATGTTPITINVGTLESFALVPPASNQIVAQVGISAQLQIQTTVCCPPDLGTYQLNFAASGLPADVTAAFSPNPVAPGSTTTMTVSAAAGAATGQNYPVTVTATPSVSMSSQSLALALDVAPAPGTLPNNRTDFIRTDGTAGSMVYDPGHQLIYASDLEWNRVDIVSPVTKTIVRSVPIPAPQGLDLSLDGSRVYVSSQTQSMFAIDTGTHAVVQQWRLPNVANPSLGPYGTAQPLVASNGNVLLAVSGFLLQWNPVANTVAAVPLPPTFHLGYLARSGDGTKIIVASDDEPGAAAVYDPATGTITAMRNFPGFVFAVQANPTGSQFIVLDDTNGLVLYDSQLNPLGSIPPGFADTGVLFSVDGSKIYVLADANGTPATFTVNDATLTVLGIAPAYATIPPYDDILPPYVIETPFYVDTTGLIYGAAIRGIALDDSTYFQALGGASTPVYDKILIPDAGPINATTSVAVVTAAFTAIPDVWFGVQRGANANLSQGGSLQVNAPPSAQPGPINVKILQPNGIQVFDPLAFSYGPAPLFLSGDTGSPSGGALADIVALGVPADASKIQVSVGGAAAQVLSAMPFNPGAAGLDVEPFPTVDVQVRLPAGKSGQADVTLTTPAGAETLSKAFQYAASVTDYLSPDTFQAIAYDAGRKNLYLAAGDHVDVFSLTSNQFGTPMSLPSAGGKKQFTGMALTPDGSKLVVANLTDGSVDIVNPDNPSTAKAVAIAPAFAGIDGLPCLIGPSYVSTTNTGKAFIVYGGLTAINCGPGGPVYELDLTSLAIGALPSPSCQQQGASYVSSSRDGAKVAFGSSISAAAPVWFIYDSASNACTNGSIQQPYGAATAGDGNVFAAGFRISDPLANFINQTALPDPYYSNQEVGTPLGNGVFPLNLEKMNDSGSLLYVPFTNSVDILDVAHGIFRQRITLAEQILQAVDALAIDPTGENVFLITDHGLTIVALNGAPLSVGSVTPSSGAAGTAVTVRGSGFVQGTTASMNGQSVSVAFADADTITLTIPALASGSVQLSLSTPTGQSYVLDNAFTVK